MASVRPRGVTNEVLSRGRFTTFAIRDRAYRLSFDAPMAEMTNVQAVSETLRAEFRRDARYIVLGEDVAKRGGVFRVTEGFLQEFGEERVIDTPLAEAAIVGVAIGAAVGGLLPVAEIQFADFSAPAFEQIVDEAARMRYRSNGAFGVPLTVRMPWGAGVHG